MTNDEEEQDDALPDELIRALRDAPMPRAAVESAVVAALRDRGVLPGGVRRTRMMPWLVAAAAAVAAAFFIGMQFGERRGAQEARLATIPAAPAGNTLIATSAGTADRSDIVLWF